MTKTFQEVQQIISGKSFDTPYGAVIVSGAKEWAKGDHHRAYFDIEMTGASKKTISSGYYDMVGGKVMGTYGVMCQSHEKRFHADALVNAMADAINA